MKVLLLISFFLIACATTPPAVENIGIDFYTPGSSSLFDKVESKLQSITKENVKYYFSTMAGSTCPGKCRTIKIHWKNRNPKYNPIIDVIRDGKTKTIKFQSKNSAMITSEIKKIIFNF